jgi:hypothetical protein
MSLMKLLIICFFLMGSIKANAGLLIEIIIDVRVVDGVGTGATGTITVGYNPTDIIGSGSESLTGTEVAVVLDLFDQDFTGADYVGSPIVVFQDGTITEIALAIAESDPSNPTPIVQPGVLQIASGNVVDDGAGGSLLQVTTNVPEPSVILLMIMGLIGLRASNKTK